MKTSSSSDSHNLINPFFSSYSQSITVQKNQGKTYPAKAEPTKGVIAPGVFDALLKKLKSCLIFEFFQGGNFKALKLKYERFDPKNAI